MGAMGVRHYLQEGTNVGLYDAIELPLKAFQTAAILEVSTIISLSSVYRIFRAGCLPKTLDFSQFCV